MQGSKKKNQSKKEVGRWNPDQHQRFMMAIATYGKDWKKVQEIVGTRSGSQVRSHAQKFFNKLLKDQNQKKGGGENKAKKHQQSNENQGEDSENSFMKYAHEDLSNTTPVQLVSLIRGESQKDGGKKVNIKNFQKTLQEHMAVIEEEDNEEVFMDNLKRQKSFKSMNNILQAYETVKEPGKNTTELENQSFLMGLTRHYKKYFAKGGCFQNLIDFGNPHQVQQLQRSYRKRSFTLPEGVQGDQQDLNQRKKRIITEQSTSKMAQWQKQSFKQAVKQKKLQQEVITEKQANQKKQSENEVSEKKQQQPEISEQK